MERPERQSQALLGPNAFIDCIPAHAWTALPDGSVESFNHQFAEYLGWSPQQASRAWGSRDELYRDDCKRFEEWWQEARESGNPTPTEARLRRADGEYRWFQISVAPIYDAGGNLVRWCGINIDIDDRKRKEHMQVDELSWRKILEDVPGFVYALDTKGDVAFVNRQTLEYFGKTTEELKDWAVQDVVHPDDLPRVIEAFTKAVEAGHSYEIEHRCKRADGVYRWFQARGRPARNAKNEITAWCFLITDIDDLKRTEQKLQQNEESLYRITQTIPGMLWSATREGAVDYCNQPWLDFASMTAEQAGGWGWATSIYPDDRDGLLECWRSCLASGTPFDMEARMRRFDGTYRWFIFRANPLRDESGKITRWYGTNIEIEDRKRREELIEASEQSWRQIIDNIPGYVHTTSARGEVEFHNRQTLEYFGKTKDELKKWGRNDIVHPDDLSRVIDAWKASVETGQNYEVEQRNRRADGVYRWFQCRARPVRNAEGEITAWYWLLVDIEDRKRAEQALQANERRLSLMIDAIPTFIQVSEPDGTVLSINQGVLEYHGLSLKDVQQESFRDRYYHPDDVTRLREERKKALQRPVPFEYEQRALGKDGTYRWFLVRYKPLLDEQGRIERWYVAAFDIEDRKRAEQKLQQHEEELRTILDAIRQAVLVLAPDGTTLYANREALEITGRTMEDIKKNAYFQVATFHPDDEAGFRTERQEGLSRGNQFNLEVRVLNQSGEYRWFLNQYSPLRDEHGRVSRWYVTATNIDEQKKTEERLRNENLVLREESDRTSLFQDIVGSSAPMRQVLKQVEKVAGSDSTVLILGETGTGKELIARALHRRSKRATRAFIRVNCAAIPESLVASELFGHEKGAFTGALQRRVGRFEAADGGTLFLDEVGELPMDTQIALLRVLQEREFERVGSNRPISIDVRVIAATNRDLTAAVTAGTFRQDLFYRLNVFPLAIPPLRERAEDIPLLLEYFVTRFAKTCGKNVRHIGKDTLRLMGEYAWPGNIRELQNVVERAVILAETDTFLVDEHWLNATPTSSAQPQGGSVLANRELKAIEAALAECHGRISGPSGAATKLGIPRQTLESKMRRLGIDRYGRKPPISQ